MEETNTYTAGTKTSTSSTLTVKTIATPALSLHNFYLLVASLSLAGFFVGWSQGLTVGYWSFFLIILVFGSANLCYACSYSEIVGVLPFSGGSYGLARLTLGTYAGYLVGCCESLSYVIYTATLVEIFGEIISGLLDTPDVYKPVYWLLFMIGSIAVHMLSYDIFRIVLTIVTLSSIALLMVYILGTASFMNATKYSFNNNGSSNNYGVSYSSAREILRVIPMAAWFFISTSSVPLSCNRLKNAKLVVPPTILWSGSLSIVLALVVLTAVSAQAPGVIVLSLSRIPYSFGYAKMFEIGRASSNAFTLPAVTVSAVTFMGSYSKQISAMSASGLYPKTLSYHYGGEDVPLAALLLGSLITYIILLVFWLIDERWPKYLFGIGLCGSFTVNFSVLMGYIVFHRVYSGLERSYNSPFRIYGAIYGILLFIFGLITVLFFQQDSYFTLYVFLVYLCVMTIYYICKAKRSQYFSQEEQAILLVAYIIKSNSGGRKKLTRSLSRRNSAFGQMKKTMSSMSMRRLNSTLSAKSGGSQTKSSARAAGASVKQGRPYRSSVNNSESTKALSSSASSAGMYDVGNDSGRDSVLTDSTGSSSDRLAGPAVAALTHMISRRMVTDSIEKIAEEDFLEDVKDGEDSNKNSIMPFATDSLEAMDQPPVNNKAINANFSKSFVCALPAKNMIEMLHQDSSSDKSAVVTLRVAAQGIQVPEETSTAEVSADSVLDRHPVLNQRSEALKSTIKPSHKNVLIGSSSRIGIEATSREVAVVDSNENFTETLNDSPSSPAPLTAFEKFKRSTSRSTSRSQSGRWVGKSISIRESFNAVVEFSGKINLSQKIAMMSPLQMEGDNDFEKYKARMMITRLSSVDNGTTDLESNLPQTESKGKRKMSMMDHLRMVQQQFEAEKGAIEQHENDIMNLYDSIDADAQEREVADSAIPYQSNAMRENVYKTRRKSWGKGQLRSSFASVDEETELV